MSQYAQNSLSKEILVWKNKYREVGIELEPPPKPSSVLKDSNAYDSVIQLVSLVRNGPSQPDISGWKALTKAEVLERISKFDPYSNQTELMVRRVFKKSQLLSLTSQPAGSISSREMLKVNSAFRRAAVLGIRQALENKSEDSIQSLQVATRLSRFIYDNACYDWNGLAYTTSDFLLKALSYLDQIDLEHKLQRNEAIRKVCIIPLTHKIKSKLEFDFYNNLKLASNIDSSRMDYLTLPPFLQSFFKMNPFRERLTSRSVKGMPESRSIKQFYLMTLKEYFEPLKSLKRSELSDQEMQRLHASISKRFNENLPYSLYGGQVAFVNSTSVQERPTNLTFNEWQRRILDVVEHKSPFSTKH